MVLIDFFPVSNPLEGIGSSVDPVDNALIQPSVVRRDHALDVAVARQQAVRQLDRMALRLTKQLLDSVSKHLRLVSA